MRNTLTDLNNALFAELENLQDESDDIEQMERKLNRAGAVAKIAETIVKNAELSFKVMQHMNEYGYKDRPSADLAPVPVMLEAKK